MDAFLPGVPGWEAIYDAPDIWHFRFNGEYPEKLVTTTLTWADGRGKIRIQNGVTGVRDKAEVARNLKAGMPLRRGLTIPVRFAISRRGNKSRWRNGKGGLPKVAEAAPLGVLLRW